MRVSNFKIYKLLPFVFWFFGCCGGFYCSSVADANETENGYVAFGDTGDVVLEVGSDGTWWMKIVRCRFE
jgi:hypothetical protein